MRRIVRTAVERLPALKAAKRRLRPTSPPAAHTARPTLAKAAGQAGWQLNRPGRTLLRDLDAQLRSRSKPHVGILCGPRGRRLDRVICDVFPDARVTRVDVGQPPAKAHVALAVHGPFDVLVDDTAGRAGKVKRFRDIVGHVRAGGVLLMRCPPGKGPAARDGSAGSRGVGLRGFVARLQEQKADDDDGQVDPNGSDPELLLARSLGRVIFRGRHVVVEIAVGFLAKVREETMNDVLELRGNELGRVLVSRPPQEFASRCTLRENRSDRSRGMPERYDVPAVSLREYHDVICAPGQIVTRDNLLFPDSFRHNQSPRLRNLHTEDLSPYFARPKADLSDADPLAGAYFYLDSEFRGHFGHAMTEVLSRLWAWPAAKRAQPELKAVMALNKGRELADFEVALFAAAGIDPSDLVLVRGPVVVERLLAATPMFSMPLYVHPEVAATWGTVGAALASSAPARSYPKKIFCARRGEKRQCHNTAEVEAMFLSHGFEVIYPEDYALAEQARIFRQAEVVAGYAGSALFNLSFCDSPKPVVMISQSSYHGRNEYMIASVLGHELNVFWCERDPGDTGHAWKSGYTFDFDRDGADLRKLLASL